MAAGSRQAQVGRGPWSRPNGRRSPDMSSTGSRWPPWDRRQESAWVKFLGPFTWHLHEGEDEMVLVVRGSFRMEFRDRSVELREGELIVVPHGTEHRPVAESEVSVLLFEPSSTLNTGNVRNDRTVERPQHI